MRVFHRNSKSLRQQLYEKMKHKNGVLLLILAFIAAMMMPTARGYKESKENANSARQGSIMSREMELWEDGEYGVEMADYLTGPDSQATLEKSSLLQESNRLQNSAQDCWHTGLDNDCISYTTHYPRQSQVNKLPHLLR